jgi:hypothetical protein
VALVILTGAIAFSSRKTTSIAGSVPATSTVS